jgi:GNAT superfamily N-acetyltransferase
MTRKPTPIDAEALLKRCAALVKSPPEANVERSISVRTLQRGDIADCSRILYSLPDWFGLEASNRAYIDSLSTSPGAVAVAGNDIVGFIALIAHTAESYEINVMAVLQDRHRRGFGSALIAWAESWCRERRVRWLHVKTRGPSTPDPAYERTRQFYLAQGFEPLFESLTEWGSENAALVLVKHLTCGS